MGFDRRTRVDHADQAAIDPAGFFDTALPASLEAAAELLLPAIHTGYARHPLVVRVDGRCWTLAVDGDRITVEPGDDHRDGGDDRTLRLRLTPDQVTDLVVDQATPMTWFSGGTLDLDGRLEHLLDWWLLVRGALDGAAPHIPGALPLVDGGGDPLDLSRSFLLDDDVVEQRDFLDRTGFLHLRGVYEPGEMADVSAEMDAAAPSYSQGDGKSWWARTGDGVDHLVRMQAFDTVSPATDRLVADERLHRIGAISGEDHRWGVRSGNRLEALFKPIGVVEGISDVPWHKDCSLGRHSYECCGMTVGVSVTGADATSGQLRVVAGSHRALVWPAFVRRDLDLPQVDLPTRTGDVTVHLSCTLHMAQPPVERERRVLYTSFRLPALDPEAAAAGRARLGAVREAAPVTVSQPPSPVSATP